MKIYEILEAVSQTSKKKGKIQILEDNKDNQVLQNLLYYCYNEFLKFHIKKVPTPKTAGYATVDGEIKSITRLLTILSDRKVTGHAALNMVEDFLSTFTEESQDIITKVIKKDLKGGFSIKTIHEVWDGLIPTFNVALANTYDDKLAKRIDIFDGSWLVSRKLDGCRCVVIKENNDIKFFSRKGHEFHTLDILKKEFEDLLKNENTIVVDGEICLVDKKGKDNFTGIMKEIKKKNHTIKNPKYFMFDMLTTEEFYSKESKTTFVERYNNRICKLIPDPKEAKLIVPLGQILVDEKTFGQMQDMVVKGGWEGLILRKNAPYKGKRSNDLLKVKKFFDAEYKVVGTTNDELTFTDKDKGVVTYMTMKSVTIKHKGFDVGVGSGWTRDQRDLYFDKPSEIIGKIITVKYFSESKDKDGNISLRFPTVKHVYEKVRVT